MLLYCDEIAEVLGGSIIYGDGKIGISGISIDSRKIRSGDLYISIKGENHDGHEFVQKALELGSVAALTEHDIVVPSGKVLIKVDSTHHALCKLASYYRNRFKIPLVGVTGSVGKTSTKDIISCVLQEKFSVLKTQGNFNNEIGLPLTMLNLDESHQVAVIEMGMSGLGEISKLTAIAKPSVAVITNIGLSHIEKLGSRQNILKAKLEILEGLQPNGLVVLNGDDHLLAGVRDLLKFKTIFYGLEDGNDYLAYNVKSQGESGIQFEIAIGSREYKVFVPVPGVQNVSNALSAIAVGLHLGLSMEEINHGISCFVPGNMRQNILNLENIKVINDAYNASPNSMEAAINVLCDIGVSKRKVAILGDMLEMGNWAESAHRDVGSFMCHKGIDFLVTVGSNASFIAEGALDSGYLKENMRCFATNIEAIEFLENYVVKGDVLLVKGSRGMKMEEIVDFLSLLNEKK